MKTIINLFIVGLLVYIVSPNIIVGDTIDEEVLVLFKPGTITMPEGKITASLEEITAPPEVLSTLFAINVLKISKGFPEFEPKDTLRISPDGWVARLPKFSNLYVLRLLDNTDRHKAILELENLFDVIYAEKNQRVHFEYEPNDTLRIYQWPISSNVIGAYRAFDFTQGSSSTRIGIIDTGVDGDHEDLQGKVLGDAGYYDYHGTHVAGIAGAKTDNDTGIVGLDWNARLWAEKISGILTASQAVINATDSGCQILNNSWGVDSFSPTLESAFIYSYQMGTLPISSMSNTSHPHYYPKRFGPWMMNVGATKQEGDEWASFSVTGYWIDVAAPGDHIYSTRPDDEYDYDAGTSFAAPHVSGIAGLLLSANPNLKNYDLEWVIKLTTTDREGPGFDDLTGYGRVNADTAVMRVIPPYEISRGNVSINLWDEGAYVEFLNQPLPDVEAGTYICDVYKAECNLNFSPAYADTPYGWINLTGFSGDGVNYANPFMGQQLTPSSAILVTFFYFIDYNFYTLESIERWAPVDTNFLSEGLRYTILGRRPINTPTNFEATGVSQSNDIKLMWSDQSSNELKFIVERSVNGNTFDVFDSVGQNVTQYIDDSVTQGQEYWYRVQAWAQEFHSDLSSIDSAIAGLAAPSTLTASDRFNPNFMYLEWTDNSLIERGFVIARKVDDEQWNYNYDTVRTDITNYPDTVTLCHKYVYKVKAYDNQGQVSKWSDSVTKVYGGVAHSDYQKMIAFNNGSKIAQDGDKIYMTYGEGDWFYRKIHILSSADTGKSFTEERTISGFYTSQPAIAMDNNRAPYVVWGKILWSGHEGTDAWQRSYYVTYLRDSVWHEREIYWREITEDTSWIPQKDSIAPPSIATSLDSGYVAFKIKSPSPVRIVSFLLSDPTKNKRDSIANTEQMIELVSIGYEGDKFAREGRVVVVMHNHSHDLGYYYRELGSATWHNVQLSNIYVYGSPALRTDNKEAGVAFEGYDGTAEEGGILFIPFSWVDTTYTVGPCECVTDTSDIDIDYVEGYSYLPSLDVATWKYNNDIWGSRRTNGQWTIPVNISDTPDSSYYPQGLTFAESDGYKLLGLWTEHIGEDFYLIRNINMLPGIPLPPSIMVTKERNDAVIAWPPVSTDTDGNPITCNQYTTHRSTSFDFVPGSDNLFAEGPDTTILDTDALLGTNNYNYLIFSQSTYGAKSAKSNMGYVFHRPISENPGETADRNWMSLPWHSEYSSVSDLTDDLSPNAEAFDKVTHLVDTTQTYPSWFYHASQHQWIGTNFAIRPGHFYEFNAVKDTTLVLVGANYPDSSRFLNENPGISDRNWVGLPYNAAYSTVSDITDEVAPSGSPINKVTHLVDSTQAQFSYFYHPGQGRWVGTDFAIEPGHGYEFVAIKDSTWNPTEWSNEEQGLFIVTPPTQKPYINMYVGTSSEPTRAPVWVIDKGDDKKVEKELGKNIDHCCVDLYRPVTAILESALDHRKNNICISDSETYKGDGTGEPRGNEDERRISHLVWTHLNAQGFENIVFTTYRLKDPHDVLTEKSAGSVLASNAAASYHLINSDVGNFKNPWKHGEEVVFIVEATKEGKAYYDVIGYKLDDKVDIQVIRNVEFKPYSTLVSGAGGLYWDAADCDNIVGYSLYQSGTRLNERVLTQRHYRAEADVNVKLVIKGGYETVYGSQGVQSGPEESIPISFAFNMSPNPFIKQTHIDYALPKQTSVEIVIYDVSGRKTKTLVFAELRPGYYSTTWNGMDDMARKVAAGVYFIRFGAGEFRTQEKVLLVK